MYQLLPASILALSLSQAGPKTQLADPIGPLAQAVYSADDDDRPELFLNREGDSDPSNYQAEEGDSDPENFLDDEDASDPANYQAEEGDSDSDNFESPDLDELVQIVRSLERALV